ncbi:hypothetical protein H1S01_19805 [Heliobacterium chlorum]|uniref:SH3b domain-containing protein n=1 Tax=Heliobacterium chlorum TaxID=2698 RepID=A0ABR7T8D9_HELCL|nr:hypothetical protein [Heliobacterium chlorum]MBC9786690.1 hypothetical protein [Heliobacterium chlorum]
MTLRTGQKLTFIINHIVLSFLFISGCTSQNEPTSPSSSLTPITSNKVIAKQVLKTPPKKAPTDLLLSDEKAINFALEASKRLAIASFNQYPEDLRQLGLDPKNIKSKNDLENLLQPYWTNKTIDYIWFEGTENPGGFNFFNNEDPNLFECNNIRVVGRTSNSIVIGADIEAYGENVVAKTKLIRTIDGWKADIGVSANKLGKINSDTVKVYEEPVQNPNQTIAELEKGTPVIIWRTFEDSQEQKWYRIQFGDKRGFILAGFVQE